MWDINKKINLSLKADLCSFLSLQWIELAQLLTKLNDVCVLWLSQWCFGNFPLQLRMCIYKKKFPGDRDLGDKNRSGTDHGYNHKLLTLALSFLLSACIPDGANQESQ